jgi:hypothetical protein
MALCAAAAGFSGESGRAGLFEVDVVGRGMMVELG